MVKEYLDKLELLFPYFAFASLYFDYFAICFLQDMPGGLKVFYIYILLLNYWKSSSVWRVVTVGVFFSPESSGVTTEWYLLGILYHISE